MAERRTLHIVFSVSAPVDLRRALQTAGKDEDVIGLDDDWSFGPPADADVRRAYIENAWGYADEEFDRQIKDFWERSLTPDGRRVVWFSRRQPREYCNFLEWLRRNRDQSFEYVDLTDSYVTAPSGRRTQVGCVSLVRESEFISEAFWDRARPATTEDLSTWRSLWDRLHEENAVMRVVTSEGLVSAPLDYFDDELLSHINIRWVQARRVVGGVMADMLRDGGVFQTSDLMLRCRVQDLVDTGVVETKGVANISMQTWLRRPRHIAQ